MPVETPSKYSDTYLVKGRESNILLSQYRFYYEDAKTAAARLGGIVTNFSYAGRNIPGFDTARLTPYPRE